MSVRAKYIGCCDGVPPLFKKGEMLSLMPHPEFSQRWQGGLLGTSDDGRVDLVWAEEVEGDIPSLFPIDVPEELTKLHGVDLSTDVGRWRAALHVIRVHGGVHHSNDIWFDVIDMALKNREMNPAAVSALREMLLTPPPNRK